MDGQTKLAREAYIQKMRAKMEATLRGVAEAVNAAPDGAWSQWRQNAGCVT